MRTPPLHHLPPLEAMVSEQVLQAGGHIDGEVQVDPTAQIAPGVLLQADPGCQIRIGAGACIGMGSILHAHGGSLVIGHGATLGVGVLVVGSGTVGAGVCVGSYSTIFDSYLAPNLIIPPGSLVGDQSREAIQAGDQGDPKDPPTDPAAQTNPADPSGAPIPHRFPTTPTDNVQRSLSAWHQAQAQSTPLTESPVPKAPKPNGIPGQADLDRLLNRIAPHRLGTESN